MNAKTLLILCWFSTFITCDDQKVPTPEFQEPVHLFQRRNFAEIIALKHPDKLSPEVRAWLETTEALDLLHEASGRPCEREIGHDSKRIEVYSGATLQPESIVLTFSAEETLEKTIEALKRERLAHNFLISQDGKIYPVTNPGETLEQALKHRAFSAGKSALVVDGFYQQRDMNSRSISISIVGKDTDPCTPEQDKALVSLISYLTETYKIRPDQVLDYGCVAYPYGRRNTQPNLPWQLLAKHQLALWPNPKDIENTNVIFRLPIIEKHWTAAALIKVGFICPLTGNDLNNDFVSALKTFQQHYQCDNQEGVVTPNTIAILNSILIQHEQLNPKLKDISPPSLPLFYNDIKGILTAIKKQNI